MAVTLPHGPFYEERRAVNASGYPFQLAVAYQIDITRERHGWDMIAQEHPWADPDSRAEGYVDILLRKGIVRAIVECKRETNATWVFLVPRRDRALTRGVRCGWSEYSAKLGRARGGWAEWALVPSSPEASFCVVRRHGQADNTFLERTCRELLLAQESVAREEIALFKGEQTAHESTETRAIYLTRHYHKRAAEHLPI